MDRQIQPLPEAVRSKAYALVDKSVTALETKLIELGSAGILQVPHTLCSELETVVSSSREIVKTEFCLAGWSVDLFLNKEVTQSLGGGGFFLGIDLLQDPEFKDTVSAIAQVDASEHSSAVSFSCGRGC